MLNMLPPKLLAKHHDFNLTEGAIIGTGAIKTVQDQLKKDNYIPLVKNEETLKDISQGNIMYIDLSWDNSSVLYINSENKESSIRDFSMIGNCYSLNECFYVTKHQHEFQVSSISITDKYKRLLKIDTQQSSKKSPYSRKKQNIKTKKTADSMN